MVGEIEDEVGADTPTVEKTCLRCHAVLPPVFGVGGCLIYGYNQHPVDALLCRTCHASISFVVGFFCAGGGIHGQRTNDTATDGFLPLAPAL